MKTQKKKITVAMSGGVDSSVVAALLIEEGYDVTGVYMKNWASQSGISDNCPWEADVTEVEKVAKHLGIPWKVYNFEKEYKERILDYFFEEYKRGRTPNPDILCNNLVKFDLCATRAFSEGAEYFATGHYARRRSSEGFRWEQQGDLALLTAIDASKDQVYFLQRLTLKQLEKALFPLGNLYKTQVRSLAHAYNLPNADRKDSQGICFIGDIDVRDFIREHLETQPGEIIDVDSGKVVGRHLGLWFYTIGQRQGIGIASNTEPYFVVGKNASKNVLMIGKGHNHPLLLKQEIVLHDVHEITAPVADGETIYVSLRYRETPRKATVSQQDDGMHLVAADATGFWAPAPGQSALLYREGNIQSLLITRKSSESSREMGTREKLKEYFTYHETERTVEVIGGGYIV